MIHGRNILIYEGDVVIAAAKSCTINNNAEAVENSSPASGTARSYTVGRTGWEISISTLVLSMKDHLLQTGHSYTLTWKERDSDTDTMTGTAICTTAQVDAAVGNLAQGSFQFLGSDSNGTVVPEPTPTPSGYVTEQDVRNIINQYGFTTEQFVENYSGIAGGTITIGDASITPVSSVAMSSNALGLTVSGSPITSAGTFTLAYATGYEGFTTALKNKIDEIYSWFEVDTNGDIKTKDTAGGHVRGFYTESFVSALGVNSQGGGGGVDLSAVWQSLKTNTDSFANEKININHIPNIGWSKIDSKPTTLSGYGITDAYSSTESRTANTVLAAPNGSNGAATFRALVAADIPTLTISKISDIGSASVNYATSSGSATTATTASKLSVVSKTAWGRTYWTSGGVPQDVSGNLDSVGNITSTNYTLVTSTTNPYIKLLHTYNSTDYNYYIQGYQGTMWLGTDSKPAKIDENGKLQIVGGLSLLTTKKIYFGDNEHYLELDSTGFHFSHGVYSDGFVSALGANSQGGGGGGTVTGIIVGSGSPILPDGNGNVTIPAYPSLSGYLPLSGGTMTGTLRVNSITASNEQGLLVYHPTSGWNGISSTQWGVGSSDSQGVIRSSSADLIHYKGGTNYTILDTSNYSSYALPLGGGTMSGNITFDAVNKGIYLTDGTNTFAGIIQNAENLWIGAQSSTATYHSGNTYISAGTGSALINRFVSGSSGTRGSYYILDSGNYSSYALPLSGGTMTGNINLTTGIGITADTSGQGLLVYHPTSGWGGISSTQWGVGSTESQGVIRSDNSNLIHYKGGTNYTICDGNNTYVSSGTGYINGSTITTISGNAGTATTLATSRTLWGQSFNGSANISGNLSDVGNITSDYYTLNNTSSNPYLKLVHSYNSTNYNYYIQAYNGLLYLGAGSANSMAISSVGAVSLVGHLRLSGAQASSSTGNTTQIIFRTSAGVEQVAISSNSSALIVNPTSSTTTKQIVLGVGSVASTFGNSITCNGEVTASSDGRKKNIISNTKFNVKDIAAARSVLFEWNDGRDDDMEKKIHGGSIAQDWLGKADSFLMMDKDGFYSINYGALALCSAITIARETIKHGNEIERLKKEVVKLCERVAELEERRVA